jgi:hypothetical protein
MTHATAPDDHVEAAARAPAAQSWSPPAWLAHEQVQETPARTGRTVVADPGRASLEEVALRMQRIKASAAAVRQAVQDESRRRPPHASPTARPFAADAPLHTPPAGPSMVAAPQPFPQATSLDAMFDDDDDLAEAPTVVDGPRPPELGAEIDRPILRQHVPASVPPPVANTATSGAFDAMPTKGFEDGFLGDLEGEEDEEFGDEEDFGDEEEGDFGGDFGDVRASRPLPWKPILVGAMIVLGAGLTVFWGRIFPSDAEPTTASEEQKADEGAEPDAAADEVAKSSVAPEKDPPIPGEGEPVVPEGEAPAVGAPAGDPAAAGAAAGAVATPGAATPGAVPTTDAAAPGAATPAAATPAAATPPVATPGAAASGAPLDPALLQQLEEARSNYRNGGRKRLKSAQELLQQILAKQPMHPDALLVMAQVQLELGLPDDSLATATTCTQVAPEMADCWLTIGVLKQERRDSAAAADAYARYLELAPDGAYAGQVSKQLKRLRK